MTEFANWRSAAAVFMLFAVNGLLVGGWGGTLALNVDKFALYAPWQVPVLLLCMGVSSGVHMVAAGRLSERVGDRAVAMAGLVVLGAAAILVATAGSYTHLVLAAVVLGGGSGLIDVGMNALGVVVSDARPRPIFSAFHASWSVGQFLGASFVLALGGLGYRGPGVVTAVMVTLAALVAVAVLVGRSIVPDSRAHHAQRPPTGKLPARVWLLGIAAWGYGIGEGTAMDWAGIHTREQTGVDPATAALGLSAMAAAMVAIRFVGDSIVARLGARLTVRLGAAVCALGYGVNTFASSLPGVATAWLLVGLGVGVISPQIYAAAGRMGGARGLSVTVTIGYVAVLGGPALMGWLRAHVGLANAMWLPALFLACIIALAGVIPTNDEPPVEQPGATS